MKIECFSDSRHDELCVFLKRFAPHHPELAQGNIIKWQKCDRFIALHDNRIVGYLAQIFHDYKYADGRIPESIGWGVTIVIDDTNNNIRKQAGRGLLTRAENNGVKYAAVGVIDGIIGPYERRGHVLHTDWCNMYARFLKPYRPLKYMGKSPLLSPLVRTINIFFDSYINFEWQRKYGSITRRINACSTENILPDDRKIDEMLKERYPLYGERTHDFIRYKISQPDKQYHICGDKKGYVIFRESTNTIKGMFCIRVCDILAEDSQSMIRLLIEVVQYAKQVGADAVIAIDAVSEKEVYCNAGLWIKKPYPMVVSPDIKEPMRITMFDSDLDNLW